MSALDPTTVWLVVAATSVISFLLRSSFLLTIDRFGGFPPSVTGVLGFVPVAVLAALVAPDLLLAGGSLAVGVGNARLLAGVVAVGVAWYTHNLLATVGVGMGALWVFLWL